MAKLVPNHVVNEVEALAIGQIIVGAVIRRPRQSAAHRLGVRVGAAAQDEKERLVADAAFTFAGGRGEHKLIPSRTVRPHASVVRVASLLHYIQATTWMLEYGKGRR